MPHLPPTHHYAPGRALFKIKKAYRDAETSRVAVLVRRRDSEAPGADGISGEGDASGYGEGGVACGADAQSAAGAIAAPLLPPVSAIN